MIKIDVLGAIPDELKRKVFDSLVDFGAEQLRKSLGNEVARRFEQLRSDAQFRRDFEEALRRAVERFVDEYQAVDGELTSSIKSGTDFFQNRDVQEAMLAVVRRPGIYLSDQHETLIGALSDRLPGSTGDQRLRRAINYLLKCIAQEVMHLSELQPSYSIHFQQITAESVFEIRKLQEIQARTNLSLTTDIRDILFQLTEALPRLSLPDENHMSPASAETRSVLHNLPQPGYHRFVGREQELQKVFALLRPYPHSREHLISIYGVGGVGKTTLAMEVAHRYVRDSGSLPSEEQFEAVVWISAKPALLTVDGIIQRPESFASLEEIFDVIALTLQREDITRAPEDGKRHLINDLLHQRRTLLIIDNFDTVDDERVTSFLIELVAPAKAVVTTRERIDVAVPIHLRGMSLVEAEQLIQDEALRKSVELTDRQAPELYERTHGLPLALVWSLSRMSFGYSVETVLESLRGPGSEVARFCFESVLNSLRDSASHRLLLSMTLFSQDAGREALGYVSGYAESLLTRDEGLAHLEKLSLVNRNKARFVVPELVKEYVIPELQSGSEFAAQAQHRFRDFYLQKLASLLGTGYWDSYLQWRNYRFLDEELSNLRILFERAVISEDWSVQTRVFNALVHYLSRTSQWQLRLELAPEAIEAAGKLRNHELLAWYHVDSLGWIYLEQGRLDLALQHIGAGEAIAREIGFQDALAQAAAHRSQIHADRREWNEARAILEPFIKEPAELSPVTHRHILTFWAQHRRSEGDLPGARNALEKAGTICTEIGDDAGLSYVRLVVAEIEYVEENFDNASRLFEQILDFERSLSRSGVIGRAQMGMAKIALHRGSVSDAVLHARRAARRFAQVGMHAYEREANSIATGADGDSDIQTDPAPVSS